MIRFLLVFTTAICATAGLHEVGHAIAGLTQGLVVVPTPFNEYVLSPTVMWPEYCVLALGGPVATIAAVVGGGWWFLGRRTRVAEAAFLGALLTPVAFSLRFLVVGRGHDGLEWMAGQVALGFSATGHALDVTMLAIAASGGIVWLYQRRHDLSRRTLWAAPGLLALGLFILIAGQVGNNALFDGLFPRHTVVGVPAEVLASRR